MRLEKWKWVLLAALLWPMAAAAQQQESPRVQMGRPESVASTARLDTLIGRTVTGQDESFRGRLRDLLVTSDGDIRFAVVQVERPQQAAGRRYLPADRIEAAQQGLAARLSAGELADLPREAPADEELFSANAMESFNVQNEQGDELGNIEGLMVNLEDMELAYLAVDEGTFRGLGENLYAVPLAAFSEIRPNQRRLVLDMTVSELRSLPSFTEEDWPEQAIGRLAMARGQEDDGEDGDEQEAEPRVQLGPRRAEADEQEARGVQERPEAVLADAALRLNVTDPDGDLRAQVQDYRVTSSGQIREIIIQAQGQRYRLPADQVRVGEEGLIASVSLDELQPAQGGPQLGGSEEPLLSVGQLRSFRAVDAEGEELGRVEGLMLDLEAMRVSYLGLSSADRLGLGENLYAVPLTAFSEIRARESELVLDISREELGRIEGFSEEEWPAEASGDFGAAPGARPRLQLGDGGSE